MLSVPRHPQRFDVLRWQEHGFDSVDDSRVWSDRACGIACVAMVVEHFQGSHVVVHDLLHEGRELGAYSARGWIHHGLARLLHRHGVQAEALAVDETHLTEVLAQILADGPVIASVTLALPTDGARGGHLILLTGISRDDGRDVVHFNDPSSWGEQNFSADLERLAASFTGRVIRTWQAPSPAISDLEPASLAH